MKEDLYKKVNNISTIKDTVVVILDNVKGYDCIIRKENTDYGIKEVLVYSLEL